YHISPPKNRPIDISTAIRDNKGDPAYHVCSKSLRFCELLPTDIILAFLPKLQDHLLGRLKNRDFDADMHDEFSDEDRNSIRFVGRKIYSVQTCRIYYTTYDLQRQSDTINPQTHPDIMLRSPETEEGADPYWYARVIGVYHANVWAERTDIPASRRMDFLWVRWLGREPDYLSGFRRARLPKIGFVESTDEFAFSFVDPANIVRGCHLIPAFHGGRTSDLLPIPRSIARCLNPGDVDDWVNFYVNIFVDRDMFMRYFGGGIGHLDNSAQCQGDTQESDSEEIEMEVDDDGDATEVRQNHEDIDMNSNGVENSEEEEEDELLSEEEFSGDNDSDGDDSGRSDEDSDDNGYASL
ncbi:hypothetical protein BDZ97DRAFT_1668206, partial [Flammula alnicola]